MTLRAVSNALAAGQYPGTTTSDNALPGMIGEYLSAIKLSAAQVTITPASTFVPILTLNLTAGDWDVWAEMYVQPTGGTLGPGAIAVFLCVGAPVTTPADNQGETTLAMPLFISTQVLGMSIAPIRLSLAVGSTVTVYGYCTFNATNTGYGKIAARRRR